MVNKPVTGDNHDVNVLSRVKQQEEEYAHAEFLNNNDHPLILLN